MFVITGLNRPSGYGYLFGNVNGGSWKLNKPLYIVLQNLDLFQKPISESTTRLLYRFKSHV